MIRFDTQAYKGLGLALQSLYGELSAMIEGNRALLSLLAQVLSDARPDAHAEAKTIDRRVNAAERSIDRQVADLISKFTVAGEELRFVLGAIKLAVVLERVADRLKNAIKHISRLGQRPLEPVLQPLREAQQALEAMLPEAAAQMLAIDATAIGDLMSRETAVQAAYRAVLGQLSAHDYPAADETRLLLLAKNLEHAADMLVEMMKICHFIHTAEKFDPQGER